MLLLGVMLSVVVVVWTSCVSPGWTSRPEELFAVIAVVSILAGAGRMLDRWQGGRL